MMVWVEEWVRLLVVLQFGCCAAMTGIIAYVQWVHYPSFFHVASQDWKAFHDRHTGMTGAIVGPLMLTELATAAVATGLSPAWWRDPLWCLGLLLLAVIWAVTWVVSVPLHHRLERGYDGGVVSRLIATNWIRTVSWTLRFLILLAWVVGHG